MIGSGIIRLWVRHGRMDTDWWDLVPDFHRTTRVPEPLLAADGRVFISSKRSFLFLYVREKLRP